MTDQRKTIPIAELIIGDRRREELGDIDALAESIKTYGLLHPIVITQDGELVAGFRRLEAVKRLGWETIPYTDLGELTENQRREIELEENIRRKDFTEYELSKNMVALAEVVAERLKVEFPSTVDKNPLGGRPPKPNSDQAVANEIGVSRPALFNARAHVSAVEAHPKLKELPKMAAIAVAKEAATLPEPERDSSGDVDTTYVLFKAIYDNEVRPADQKGATS